MVFVKFCRNLASLHWHNPLFRIFTNFWQLTHGVCGVTLQIQCYHWRNLPIVDITDSEIDQLMIEREFQRIYWETRSFFIRIVLRRAFDFNKICCNSKPTEWIKITVNIEILILISVVACVTSLLMGERHTYNELFTHNGYHFYVGWFWEVIFVYQQKIIFVIWTNFFQIYWLDAITIQKY